MKTIGRMKDEMCHGTGYRFKGRSKGKARYSCISTCKRWDELEREAQAGLGRTHEPCQDI